MNAKFYNSKNVPKPNKPIHFGAVGIIRKDDKILLERRKNSDRWVFIGGGLKMEEFLRGYLLQIIYNSIYFYRIP